jgi:TonB family protein
MRHREETAMMYPRLQALSCVWVALVSAGAAVHAQERSLEAGQPWQLAGAFPQSRPGPLERQANPITPENPIPRRLLIVRPSYPSEAAVVGARATINLRVTVDHLGTVAEVRTIGGPVLGAMAPPSPSDDGAFTAGLLALVQSAKDAVRHWLYEPPAEAPIAFTVVIGFSTQEHGEVISQNASPTAVAPAETPDVPVHGSSGSRPATKVKHVTPLYPAAAREANIAGIVVLEVGIGADGRVVETNVLQSVPELDQAAIDAVMQWEYVPLLVDGVPTPTTIAVTVQFSL